MAERGAHLTGTAYGKPTIFEIVAQESLASTLEPAFRKIFHVCANTLRFISCAHALSGHWDVSGYWYGWAVQWSDEAYLLFHGCLQNFYLKKYAASFSESFYGLKRISLSDNAVKGHMSWRQEKLAVILLIAYPYLRAKAEKYKLDEIDGRLPKTHWERILRSCFVRALTIYHYVRETSALFYHILYICGRTEYPAPIYRLLSTTLTYSRPEEVVSIPELLRKLKDGSFHTGDGVQLLQRTLTRSLELGAFFLQFLQWWNQENYYTNMTTLPAPPAPTVPALAKSYKGLCPVCRKTRRIHTALSVSGYVFCYQCILPIVRQHGVCPVTRLPAKEDDLIRLYVDT